MTNSAVGEYFEINGSAVSVAIKAIEKNQGKEKKLIKDLVILEEKVLTVI